MIQIIRLPDLSKFQKVQGFHLCSTSSTKKKTFSFWDSKKNRMPLNMKKTWEIVVRGNISRPLADPIPTIERIT